MNGDTSALRRQRDPASFARLDELKAATAAPLVKASVLDPRTHAKILHALVVADRRQKTNPYALAHYCGALQRAEEMMVEGLTLREALKSAFCGRLVAQLIKAAGLPPLTDAEVREVR